LKAERNWGRLTSGHAEVASLIDTFKVELVVPVSV